ncbi:hypothetical protein [Streptomyces sp. NBC_01381]|uniref:hypothetical protein n=1 Tax=Streptomyces sp. NBC_01381 TaxID=2903845 RepID=UPI00339046D1
MGDETAAYIERKGWAHVDTFKDERESGTLAWDKREGATEIMSLAQKKPCPFNMGKPWSEANFRVRLLNEALLEARYVFRGKSAKVGPDGTPVWGPTSVTPLDPMFTPEEVTELRSGTDKPRRVRSATGRIYTLTGLIQSQCGKSTLAAPRQMKQRTTSVQERERRIQGRQHARVLSSMLRAWRPGPGGVSATS